jgi:cytoskeletal protein CcmA (bactofilin family)
MLHPKVKVGGISQLCKETIGSPGARIMDFWKRKDEPPPAREEPQPVFTPVKEVTPVSTSPQERKLDPMPSDASRGAVAHIGKSVVVKGELSGSEDLYIDGQVEGTVELREHNLTIGPHGRVQANVTAKEVVLHGTLKGNVRAVDRVEIRKSGSLVGDVVAARVMIEDGASIKGSVDIQKPSETAAKAGEIKKPDARAPVVADSQSKYAASPIEAKKLN